jgi:hypothetical protein
MLKQIARRLKRSDHNSLTENLSRTAVVAISDATIQTPITVIALRVSKIKLRNRRQRMTTIDNSPSRRSQTQQQAGTANHRNGFTTVENASDGLRA